ncbi:LysR family transcriptional regulator [Vibrio ostreicida]|uniref:LysR family transcriptional regulator n=1 Tax=Vibrio ostreicida TaxID=526588 RepID=A0ABT8BSV7_9VIBR|nr:LysR family transcriptional regulator [Vibrio ostreicida]MDN3609529.1 LysR family transcriptional regulator [Vibrio ostreicida]NPD08406.1 LysR family transcriptional regulator [Vibrio ostreicida]
MDSIIAMRSFVRVVELGSFSAVAKEQNTNQATISKRLAALENMLGAQLLIRGSRKHTLTEVGQRYFDRVSSVLLEIDEAEAEARSLTEAPQGTLKVTVPTMFGGLYVAPIIAEFLATYPEIELEIKFDENMIDLVNGGIDVAIRLGNLVDSSMLAKTLGYDQLVIVASPNYLERHCAPKHPNELQAHNCLIYSLSPKKGGVWKLSNHNETLAVAVQGNFRCDNGMGLKEMLLANAGLALMPRWLVWQELESGQLVHVLQDYATCYPISAVFPQHRYLPLKVRCFIEFVEQKIKADSAFCKLKTLKLNV